MNSVHVITDSACDLTDEQTSEARVTVVPLSIRFGTEEFTDRVQLSTDQFWARMATTPGLPETAAPSPGAFELAFRSAHAAGASGVVCITLSAALSATHQSAVLGARAVTDEFPSFPVTIIDSKSITAGQGTMVLAAAETANRGAEIQEVVQVVQSYIGRSFVYGTIDSLENLRKGGRIGGAQAMLGSLLAIKPLINVSSGTVEEAGKQRTRSRALATLVAFLEKAKAEHGSVSNVAVMHGNASQADLATLHGLLSHLVDPSSITVGRIGAVIGTHGGLGVIGLCFVAPAAPK